MNSFSGQILKNCTEVGKNFLFNVHFNTDCLVCNLRNKQDIPNMSLLNLAADDLLHSKNTLKHPKLKYGITKNI